MPPEGEPATEPADVNLAPAPVTDGADTPPADTPPADPPAGGDTSATEPADKGADDFSWPDDWRERIAGDNESLLKDLRRYNSIDNVAKANLSAKQKLRSGEYMKAKPDATDEAGMKEWREQMGIPEKFDGYFEGMPDGIVIGDEDKQLAESFAESMHSIGAPPEYVHQALKWHTELAEKQAEAQAEFDSINRQQNEDDLRSKLGTEYRATINSIQSIVTTHGVGAAADKIFGARMEDGSLVGDDPEVIEFFANIARDINPRGTVVPKPGQDAIQTIDQELATLQAEMKSEKNPDPMSYWHNPQKQARYQELLELKKQYQKRS